MKLSISQRTRNQDTDLQKVKLNFRKLTSGHDFEDKFEARMLYYLQSTKSQDQQLSKSLIEDKKIKEEANSDLRTLESSLGRENNVVDRMEGNLKFKFRKSKTVTSSHVISFGHLGQQF